MTEVVGQVNNRMPTTASPIVAKAASPTEATAKDAAIPRLDEPKETARSHVGLAESKTITTVKRTDGTAWSHEGLAESKTITTVKRTDGTAWSHEGLAESKTKEPRSKEPMETARSHNGLADNKQRQQWQHR